jgi:hypothetical protein
MENVSINFWAVLVAAVSAFVLGGVWYSPILFAKPWMAGAGLSEGEVSRGNPAKIFGLSFVLTLVMAANLAAFLSGPPNLAWGVTAGALAGIWVVGFLGILYLFEHRPLKLYLINGGYCMLALMIMGGILGLWK